MAWDLNHANKSNTAELDFGEEDTDNYNEIVEKVYLEARCECGKSVTISDEQTW